MFSFLPPHRGLVQSSLRPDRQIAKSAAVLKQDRYFAQAGHAAVTARQVAPPFSTSFIRPR